MVAVLALFSEVVVPRVVAKLTPAEPPAAEQAEEAPEAEEADGEDGEEVARLRQENRILRELVGAKEAVRRQNEEETDSD